MVETCVKPAKQTASSLDWFDLMWFARQDIPKVHAAINQHKSGVYSLY